MYCPECGKEESHPVPFCRACGTDLRRVRVAVETPDSMIASAMSARDEIGRAVAAKIRETQDAYELKKVAEDVLPQMEKFLESPKEKRLRGIRLGVLLSSIGLGIFISLSLVALLSKKEEFLFLAGFGFILFFIGIGFAVNAVFLTVPRERGLPTVAEPPPIAGNRIDTNDLELRPAPAEFSSVTEQTTRHLKEK